jgi:hypothetical protein
VRILETSTKNAKKRVKSYFSDFSVEFSLFLLIYSKYGKLLFFSGEILAETSYQRCKVVVCLSGAELQKRARSKKFLSLSTWKKSANFQMQS